jgi:hypothetical protein
MFQGQFEQEEPLTIRKENPLDLKNRFLLFATILKLRAATNYPVSFLALFIELAFGVFSALLPVLPYFSLLTGNYISGLTFFPILVSSSSEFLSVLVWLLVSLASMIISLVAFGLCIHCPEQAVRVWWLLHPLLHFVLVQFQSLAWAFSLAASSRLSHFTFFVSLIILVDIVVFPFYVVLSCSLFSIDTNSIIHPNPIYCEWFYGFSFVYPLVNAATITLSTLCDLAGYPSMIYPAISMVIQCLVVFYLLFRMPFMLALSNELLTTKSLFCLFSHIFVFVIMKFPTPEARWFFVAMPFLFAILFFMVYIISHYRQGSMHLLLKQFDDSVRDFSVEAIRLTLSSIHSEREFQWVIRESFLGGNETVLSQRFLQFCLETFPNSDWLFSMVTFLVAVVWGSRPSVYRALLHLFSVQSIPFVPSLILFQCIFAHQQSSSELPPMIQRNLLRCRGLMLRFAHEHAAFWKLAAHGRIARERESTTTICALVRRLERELVVLECLYPYSSAVHFELSLYYADVLHDYDRACAHFERAEALRTGAAAISRLLYRQFIEKFPITPLPLADSAPRPNSRAFVSFHDKHENATRCLMPRLADSYFSGCQAWSPSAVSLDTVDFDRRKMIAFKVAVPLATLILFTFLVENMALLLVCFSWIQEIEHFESLARATAEFRASVVISQMDALLVYTVPRKDYGLVLSDQVRASFWEFLEDHLLHIYDEMIAFCSLIDSMTDLQLTMTIPDCPTVNCSFAYVFGSVHNIGNYYLAIHGTIVSPEYSPETLSVSTRLLLTVAENVYGQFLSLEYQTVTSFRGQFHCFVVISFIVRIFLFFVILLTINFLVDSLERNYWSVIQATPSSVLADIAGMFQRLHKSGFPKKPLPRWRLRFRLIASSFLCVIIGFIPPLFLYVTVNGYDMAKPDHFGLPPTFPMNEEFEFLSFAVAWAEFSLQYENDTDFDHDCFHALANSSCDNCSIDFPRLRYSKSTLVIIMTTACLLAIPFLLWFLLIGLDGIGLSQTMHHMLKEIPQRVKNTNFVLKQHGAFGCLFPSVHDIFMEWPQGCVIYFEEDGTVRTHLGDPLQYFSIRPMHIDDIQRALGNAECGTAQQIQNFFAEGKNGKTVSVSISLRPYCELLLSLSHQGRVLFVTDNSHHHVRNQQIRRMQALTNGGIPKSEKVERAAVIVFHKVDANNRKKIIELAGDLELKDRRYHELVFVKKIVNADEDRTVVNRFLVSSLSKLGSGKCAAAVGGPLIIFGSGVGFNVLRNRIFGRVYEIALQMIQAVQPREMAVQKQLFVPTRGEDTDRPCGECNLPCGTIDVVTLS